MVSLSTVIFSIEFFENNFYNRFRNGKIARATGCRIYEMVNKVR